jgi:lysophospholipase L1-like esterase
MESQTLTRPDTRQRGGALAATIRLVALALSVAVALVSAEVGMRLAGYSPAYVNAMGSFHQPDPVTGHRGRPNFSARFKTPQFDVLVAHDQHGFRRQDFQNPLSAASRRLFVFGDSFVWGWGVDQGEVFTDCMSRRMPAWHIENLGINGTGTVAQYELFANECRDHLHSGDVVLVVFFGNDFSDNVEGTRRAEVVDGNVVVLPADAPSPQAWQATLKESSYLVNYVSYVANRCQLQWRVRRAHRQAVELAAAAEAQVTTNSVVAQGPTSSSDAAVDSPPTVAVRPALPGDAAAQITVTRHYLDLWKHDCQRRGVSLLVAYIPGVTELDEGGNAAMAVNERAFREAFFSCTDSLSIESIDLRPGMLDAKQAAGIEHLLIPGDGHWNATAHQIVAGIIASRLTDASTARR